MEKVRKAYIYDMSSRGFASPKQALDHAVYAHVCDVRTTIIESLENVDNLIPRKSHVDESGVRSCVSKEERTS
jgi:hypothetical protein